MRASFFVDRCAYKGHILDEATKVAHNAQLRRQRSVRRTYMRWHGSYGGAVKARAVKRVRLPFSAAYDGNRLRLHGCASSAV